LRLTVPCTMISYRLDRVLLCQFCRGSGASSGRQGQWLVHRATQPLSCSNSSPREIVLLSHKHRTLRISLRVTFGCPLLWRWASRGHVTQPLGASNKMRRPNSGTFQKKPSVGDFRSGSIDGASVCVRACAMVLLWRWLG
jgi:hypothetical protein